MNAAMNRIPGLLLILALCALPLANAAGQAKPAKPAATRTEHDLLGDKAVPADAYYGVQTARALENFQISNVPINTYPEFIEGFAMVKLAAARANTKLGAMKPERLTAINKAYDALMAGKYRDQFMVDWYQGGAGTSANMNVNEVMANIGLELTGHKKGEYASINLLMYPAARVMVGGELRWGKLHNNDGTTGDDVRFQFSAKYDFGAKL